MADLSRIHELKKKKDITFIDDVSVSDLLLKDEDGETFFEYLIDNNRKDRLISK